MATASSSTAAATTAATRPPHQQRDHHHGSAVSNGGHPRASVSAPVVVVPASASTPLEASASVGHDHWANDVLRAIGGPPDASTSPPAEDAVARKVMEKKRKFHSGRMLELKNLPDGCTEQVRKVFKVKTCEYVLDRPENRKSHSCPQAHTNIRLASYSSFASQSTFAWRG